MTPDQVWRLEGHDPFSYEDYPLGTHHVESNGRSKVDGMKPFYSTYEDALADARKRLADLEVSQPSSSSGGQGLTGIQDRVKIIHPDGHRERVV